jgi:hypothetical protein
VVLVTARTGSVDDPAGPAEDADLTHQLASELPVQEASSCWTLGSAAPLRSNDPHQDPKRPTRKESAMYDQPSYIWALVLIGVIGIPAITCLVLYRGAIAAGLGRRTATAVVGGAAAVLGGWLLASGLLARADVYHQASGQAAPWFGVAVAGTLTGLLAATRIPVVARVLAAPGTAARLAVPHTLRVVGVTFLLVMAQGRLPAVFALPAGLGDIAAGLAAPFVARGLAQGGGRSRAVWFNLFGILDLVVALTVGFLAGLGPWQPLAVTPSTEPLSLLPLALVPTTAVPLSLALHLVSLRRLRAATPPEQDRTGQLLPAGG